MTKTTGTMEELIVELRTRGAWAAYNASREVCDNRDAPANSRVQGASNILRAAGFFALRAEDGAAKEPSELSYDELARATSAVLASLSGGTGTEAEADNSDDGQHGSGGVFE